MQEAIRTQIGSFQQARAQAQFCARSHQRSNPRRLQQLDDLSADRGEIDLIDETTGNLLHTMPAPIAVVSDDGPCFRGETFTSAFAGEDPLLRHVRTRVSPRRPTASSNDSSATLKYEQHYRGAIDDGDALAVEINRFRHIYNQIRPHQALHDRPTRRLPRRRAPGT